MEPLLHHHKSYAQIRFADRPLRVGEIALFECPNGECILHRVMKIRADSYLFVGDNCSYIDEVPKDWVLGIMEGYYPDMDTPYVDCSKEQEYRSQTRAAYFHYCILCMRLFLRRIYHWIMREA